MYIRGFDGLRALAMAMVFFTHKTVWGAKSELGFAGVWVFFLLSGFLIVGQLGSARLAVESNRTTVWRELFLFWIKRALRIFPAYYVLIAILIPFYYFTARDIPGLPWYLSYLSNIYFQYAHADFLTTWAHFWTLAVEEQFYVLFAPLILFIPSRHSTAACALVVLMSLVQRIVLTGLDAMPYMIYVDSFVNFGLLAFGALMALHRTALASALRRLGLGRDGVGWVAMVGVLLTAPAAQILSSGSVWLLQLPYVVGVLVAALLLVNVYTCQSGTLVRILEWRPIAHVGRVSYGLYLYNDYVKSDIPKRILEATDRYFWPLGGAPGWIDALLRDGGAGSYVLQAAGLAVCLALLLLLANLSWTFIERPALALRRRLIDALDGRLAWRSASAADSPVERAMRQKLRAVRRSVRRRGWQKVRVGGRTGDVAATE